MSEVIQISAAHLNDIIRQTAKETAEEVLAQQGVKGSLKQSGRIYRKQMIETLGYRGYNEAVQKGWLRIQKHDPMKRNSRVYAKMSDWDRFIELYNTQNK